MLFLQRRDIASAISFLTPGTNSSVKLNSLNLIYHRVIIGFEASLIDISFDDLFLFQRVYYAEAIINTYKNEEFHKLPSESLTNIVGIY